MHDIVDEYDPEYCLSLEMAYGKGMMSEGGEKALAAMFAHIPTHGKSALDVGAGLGGAAIYLATQHDMDVTGLEINPWMVEEATRRIPPSHAKKLRYVRSTDNAALPFEDASFDIVYSRGVFCHVEHKVELFRELHRVLKPGGYLVVYDWLSPERGVWGPHVQQMADLDGLSIFAETIEGYKVVLTDTQFLLEDIQDLSEKYATYNDDIVHSLESSPKKELFIKTFSEKLHEEAVTGYKAIAEAMRAGEGIGIQFTARKAVSQQ